MTSAPPRNPGRIARPSAELVGHGRPHPLAARSAVRRDLRPHVESAIVTHEKVAESAVVAQTDDLTGQAIVAFVTLAGDLEGSPEIEAEIREHVAERIGKLARPKRIVFSDDLPKTRSGKIMRRLLRDIAEGRALGDVTALRDPSVVAALARQVAASGAATTGSG